MALGFELVAGKASEDAFAAIAMAPTIGQLVPAAGAATGTAGQNTFTLAFEVADDAPGGVHEFALVITPTSPAAFSDRGVTVPVTIEVIPLSFWERYGTWVLRGLGGVFALIVLLGFVLPARFNKRAILYCADVRDPELIRRSSYPLGTKAKRGFYRAASVRLGPSGPVKKGGAITLKAGPGGRIEASPASTSATVFRVDVSSASEQDDYSHLISDTDDDERPRMSVKQGSFRTSAGVGYEVKGAGFVFWYK